MRAPLATMPAFERLAADRATGIGPGAAAARRGARYVGGIERLAGESLAGLDPGAARHRAGIKGLAADRATGVGPGPGGALDIGIPYA